MFNKQLRSISFFIEGLLQPYYKSVTKVLKGKDAVGVIISTYIFAYSVAAKKTIVPHILFIKQ